MHEEPVVHDRIIVVREDVVRGLVARVETLEGTLRAVEELVRFRLPERFLRIAEASEVLGVSTHTLYRWRQEKRFPRGRKLYGSLGWFESEVKDFLLEHAHPAEESVE